MNAALSTWAAASLVAVMVAMATMLGTTRPPGRTGSGPPGALDRIRRLDGVETKRPGTVAAAPDGSPQRPAGAAGGEGPAVGELAERLAAQLRSGASLPEAIAGASTTEERLGGDLETLCRKLRRGEAVDESLAEFGAVGSTERALLVAALRMVARHGGRTADALDGVAGTVRDRTAVNAELAAQTSQARYSAWVLAALPPLFLVLGAVVDPRLLGALVSWGGAAALAVALAFELLGAVWIRRILIAGARSIGHR